MLANSLTTAQSFSIVSEGIEPRLASARSQSRRKKSRTLELSMNKLGLTVTNFSRNSRALEFLVSSKHLGVVAEDVGSLGELERASRGEQNAVNSLRFQSIQIVDDNDNATANSPKDFVDVVK